MLKGIKQSDKELLPVIQDYGCLFLCFANASPMIFLNLKKDDIIYYTPSAERYKYLNGGARECEGKIFFADSNSKNNTLYSIYPLRDTLEKYTYNELEHLCFHFTFHHYMSLKYMELYNY